MPQERIDPVTTADGDLCTPCATQGSNPRLAAPSHTGFEPQASSTQASSTQASSTQAGVLLTRRSLALDP
eukprot:scaffold52228_cov35-Phaeocystis_antarctica.AAC.2